MQKDLKTGLISGLILIIAALVYISTRPSLSTRARMLKANQLDSHQAASDYQLQSSEERYTQAADPKQWESSYKQAEEVISKQTQKPKTYTYQQSQKIKTYKFHIVRRGETLSGIARRYYGFASRWPVIYKTNRDVIGNPDVLIPGTKLVIPN